MHAPKPAAPALPQSSCGIWNTKECAMAKETIVALAAIASVVALLVSIGMVLAVNGVPMGPVNALVTQHVTEQIIYATLIASFIATVITVTLLFLIAQSNCNKQIPAKEVTSHRGADGRGLNLYERVKRDLIDVKLDPGQYWAGVDSGVAGMYGPTFWAVTRKDWSQNGVGVVAFRTETDLNTYLYRLGYQNGKTFFETCNELPIRYVHSIHGEDLLNEYQADFGYFNDLKVHEQVAFATGLVGTDVEPAPAFVLVTKEANGGIEVRYFKTQDACHAALNEAKYNHCLAKTDAAQFFATYPQYNQYRSYINTLIQQGRHSCYFHDVQRFQKANGAVVLVHSLFWISPDGTTGEAYSLSRNEINRLIQDSPGMQRIAAPSQQDLQAAEEYGLQQASFFQREQLKQSLNAQMQDKIQKNRLDDLLIEPRDAYSFNIQLTDESVYEALVWRKDDGGLDGKAWLQGAPDPDNREAYIGEQRGNNTALKFVVGADGSVLKAAAERLIPEPMDQEAYAVAVNQYSIPDSLINGDYLRLPALNTGMEDIPQLYPLVLKREGYQVANRYFTSPEARDRYIQDAFTIDESYHDLAEKFDIVRKLGATSFANADSQKSSVPPSVFYIQGNQIFKTGQMNRDSSYQYFVITRGATEITTKVYTVTPQGNESDNDKFQGLDVLPHDARAVSIDECYESMVKSTTFENEREKAYGNDNQTALQAKQYIVLSWKKNDNRPALRVIFAVDEEGKAERARIFLDPALQTACIKEFNERGYARKTI